MGIEVTTKPQILVTDELRRAYDFLHGLVAGMTDKIAARDTELRFMAFNPAYRDEYKKVFGVDIKIGMSLADSLGHMPEVQKTAVALWRRALAGETFSLQQDFADPGRQANHYEFTFFPIRDPSGRIVGAGHSARDISARYRAQEALREAKERLEERVSERTIALAASELRYRTLSEATFEGIGITQNGRLVDANHQFVVMHGYSEVAEVLGQPLSQFLRPQDHARALQAMQGGAEQIGEYCAVRKDGSEFFIEAHGRSAEWNDQPARLTALRDITDRKRTEEALRQAQAELARANVELETKVEERTAKLRESMAELEHLSYSISHDMRSPVRAMNGFAEALLEDYGPSLDAQGREYLERIRRAALRQDILIQDVLTYTRVVREQVHLEPIDLNRLVEDILLQYAHLQPPALTVDIQAPLPWVLGHDVLLIQCLSNLLGNAAKFIAPGTRAHATLWASAAGDRWRLWIADNGIGIAPENQQRIFGLFQQLHSHHEYEGTGVGLAVVRKAVERMGGNVGVESALGQGSRFWIELRAVLPEPISRP